MKNILCRETVELSASRVANSFVHAPAPVQAEFLQSVAIESAGCRWGDKCVVMAKAVASEQRAAVIDVFEKVVDELRKLQ